MTRVLVLDNYDSFVFNLVQYLGELGAEPVVHRNDALTWPRRWLSNPTPCWFAGAGPSRGRRDHLPAIAAFAERGTPVLGVCLGHQAIGLVYGATIVGATELMHGKTSPVEHDGRGVFAGLPSPLTATRYHSLTIDPATLPDELEVTATTVDGTIMGVRHRTTTSRACSSTPRACSPCAVTTSCGPGWPAR